MFSLFRRRTLLGLIVAGISLVAIAASAQDEPRRGRKYTPPPETARIEVTVVRASNSKPIVNAAVVFHPMEGEKDKGNMELKTNEDGKAIIDVIPIGDVVRLQVIAPGFKTFGEDYKIEGAEKMITVKMQRPGQQYSIYKDNTTTLVDAPKTDDKASPDGQSAPKPADKSSSTKPADDKAKPDTTTAPPK